MQVRRPLFMAGGGFVRRVWLAAGAGLGLVALTTATQDANANGETRALSMVHAHTGETINIVYKREGTFESGALEKLNWFLRDWRVDEPIAMSPQLFDVIWYVYREVGASEPVKVMSAYRSPGTNAMLRRRSRAVAKESQHMRGNAMDIHIPGVSMARVREIGMRLQRGGVGYYPSAGSPFVHLDVGSVRSWPRMPREQLERLFPDGKTVHIPADGIPLSNYQLAYAEIQARGGTALDYETVNANRGKSLWALLFGGDEDEDSREVAARGTRVAARGRAAPPQQVAAAPASGDRVSAWGTAAPVPVEPAPRVVAAAPVPAPEPAKAEIRTEPAKAEARVESSPPVLIAAMPVPPIRPRGAAFAQLVAAHEPLPPIRPGLPVIVAGAEPAPVTVAGMPLPPARPAAAAALPGILAPPGAPDPALVQAYAPVVAPAPPARPAPPPVEVAALGATRSLRGALARPASPAPSPALAIRGALIADPTAPPAPPKPDTLAMGFSKAGAMVMPGMTFTGGFIRPIGMGFTKPGE
ncbi:DUF882 domain-containing protein [Rhabdaerophilum calidifontis]|uniref:DUF882 domain-containing protein n=1 Tax=Rhabdaerophilum calidifontis TaxID=2604328 RepID=UPI00123BBDA8|nr:DUF882 domain-containing protein [Rhabdaerophilum calidifontis]